MLTLQVQLRFSDLDTQGHSGKSLGLDVRGVQKHVFHLLTDSSVKLADVTHPTAVENLFAVPGDEDGIDRDKAKGLTEHARLKHGRFTQAEDGNIQRASAFDEAWLLEMPDHEGRVALLHGRWTLKGTAPDGSAIETSGRNSEVVRRQPDGGWLFAIDNPFTPE